MTQHYNRSSDREKRRELRRKMTPPEARPWSVLRGRRMLGYRFRDQYGVDRYVLDFYCPSLKLAIELDGDSHYVEGAQEYDAARQQAVEGYGIRFIRFTNPQVMQSLDIVVQSIQEAMVELGAAPDAEDEPGT